VIQYTTLSEMRAFSQGPLREGAERLMKSAESRGWRGSTFLSHSSLDSSYLPYVVTLLENHGAHVYLDKKDDSLPGQTSRETAIGLRRRIDECARLVLFATPASKDSRWMPWELGVGDGLKRSSGIAVLPAVENRNDKTWTEREYLGVYDRIVWGDLEGFDEKLWLVYNHEKNTACPLGDWLRK
jgi:hypothetical protein